MPGDPYRWVFVVINFLRISFLGFCGDGRQVRLVSFFVSFLFVPAAENPIVVAWNFLVRPEISRFFLTNLGTDKKVEFFKEGELVCVPGVAAQTLDKARVVAACAVIATGALYVLLGLCCCRGIRRGAQLRYRRRLAHADLRRAFLAERAYRTRGGAWPRPDLLLIFTVLH